MRQAMPTLMPGRTPSRTNREMVFLDTPSSRVSSATVSHGRGFLLCFDRRHGGY